MTEFVTVEARDLRQAMKPVLAVVERRNTIPILSCARITLTADGISVTGTDLDIEITATMDVMEAGKSFNLCIDARKLAEIAAAAGVMPMRIEKTEAGARITLDNGAAIYDMTALPAADFPDMSGQRGELIEQFGNGSFAALLSKVKWCISTEDTRYYLNGIAWQAGPAGRTFTATDGHKLASCRYSKDVVEQPCRIIHRKVVGIIIQHLKNADVKVFERGSTGIDILSPGLTIRSKLIDGPFPDWSRVVPTVHEHVFRLNVGEITTAINQAAAIGSDRTRAIRFAPDDGKLVVEHKSPEFGKAAVKTQVAWPGKAEDFGFNMHYFRMVAGNCDSEMEIRMTDRAAPFSFHDSDETMTRVLMPMRV